MSYKIMVVDDSPDIRDLMNLLFTPEGYEVAEASNGEQALFKLSTESLPDLIFLDNNMDIMDGPTFLLEMERLHPEMLARIPIIMLTGTETHLLVNSRVTEIVAKQMGIEPLLSLVKRYLH